MKELVLNDNFYEVFEATAVKILRDNSKVNIEDQEDKSAKVFIPKLYHHPCVCCDEDLTCDCDHCVYKNEANKNKAVELLKSQLT